MQPTQIAEGAGITTRQQRKRVSSETHQGPGTPEVGDLGLLSPLAAATFSSLLVGSLLVQEGGRCWLDTVHLSLVL